MASTLRLQGICFEFPGILPKGELAMKKVGDLHVATAFPISRDPTNGEPDRRGGMPALPPVVSSS